MKTSLYARVSTKGQAEEGCKHSKLSNLVPPNKDKVRVKNEIESGKGLTPLGRQLLLGREESEKQQIQLSELKSQLSEISVKIEELQVKMKARRFVFSGEVYLRQ